MKRAAAQVAMIVAMAATTGPGAELVDLQHQRHRPPDPMPYRGKRKSKGRKRMPWEGKRR